MDPSEFRNVGIALGFTEAQLNQFEKDKLGNSMQASYQMLYEWRKTVRESKAREILVNKLESIKLVKLADSVRKGNYYTHTYAHTRTHAHTSPPNKHQAYICSIQQKCMSTPK